MKTYGELTLRGFQPDDSNVELETKKLYLVDIYRFIILSDNYRLALSTDILLRTGWLAEWAVLKS
jgi:hypothetical protein